MKKIMTYRLCMLLVLGSSPPFCGGCDFASAKPADHVITKTSASVMFVRDGDTTYTVDITVSGVPKLSPMATIKSVEYKGTKYLIVRYTTLDDRDWQLQLTLDPSDKKGYSKCELFERVKNAEE